MKYASSLVILFYTLAVPVILTLISVRLVMTPTFLHFEYYRPDFPDDRYGFSTEERMLYARQTLDYLIYNQPLDSLRNMTFSDGERLFNERELRHMDDVQVVTRIAYFMLFWLSAFAFILGVWVWRDKTRRHILQDGLFQGGILTLLVIGAIVVIAVAMWNVFFDAFHSLLFEAGTWRFAYSDSLIRLFPERFWFDAALTVGIMTALSAGIIVLMTWRGRTRDRFR